MFCFFVLFWVFFFRFIFLFRRFVRLFFTYTRYGMISLYFQFQYFSNELLPPIPTGKIFQTTDDFCNRWAIQVAPKTWCHHSMAWRRHGNFLQDLSSGAAKFCRGSWRHIGGKYLWLYFSNLYRFFFLKKRLITEQNSFKKMGNIMNYVMYHRPLLQEGNLLNLTPTW